MTRMRINIGGKISPNNCTNHGKATQIQLVPGVVPVHEYPVLEKLRNLLFKLYANLIKEKTDVIIE